jgi:hypothetical protein
MTPTDPSGNARTANPGNEQQPLGPADAAPPLPGGTRFALEGWAGARSIPAISDHCAWPEAAASKAQNVAPRLLKSDTRGHEAASAPHARASTNAGLDPRVATHPLVATCGAHRDLRSPVPYDDRREVPRFLESGARLTVPRIFRERVCAAFPAQTRYARRARNTAPSPAGSTRPRGGGDERGCDGAGTDPCLLAAARRSQAPETTPSVQTGYHTTPRYPIRSRWR